jgi:hypothetical protein
MNVYGNHDIYTHYLLDKNYMKINLLSVSSISLHAILFYSRLIPILVNTFWSLPQYHASYTCSRDEYSHCHSLSFEVERA